MPNIEAARADVQKVVAFLVSRYGREEDVFAHLSSALTNLEDAPASSSGTEAASEAVADSSPAAAPPKQAAKVATKASKPGPPAKTRKGMGR